MAKTPTAYVLDSYALLAYFQAEAGGPAVRALFEAARDGEVVLYLSLINVGEIYYLMSRHQGVKRADELLRDLRNLPLVLVPATEERIMAAARLKAEYPLSYADSFAAALAQEFNATLVTGDPEFKSVSGRIPVMWLLTQS